LFVLVISEFFPPFYGHTLITVTSNWHGPLSTSYMYREIFKQTLVQVVQTFLFKF